MGEPEIKRFGYQRPSIGPDEPGYVDGRWRPGMDPNYSGPYTEPTADGGGVSTSTRFDDIAPRPVYEALRALAELPLRLNIMPIGYRIRALRFALGWTQATAAGQLGISTRTVIRHEQGRNIGASVRAKLFLRLLKLESDHAEQLAAYLSLVRRENVWGPSQLSASAFAPKDCCTMAGVGSLGANPSPPTRLRIGRHGC